MSFTWEICGMCGWMVRCPKCGMNCCSGAYGEVEGKPCDVCPQAYAYQDAECKAGRAPKMSVAEKVELCKTTRARMQAMGVKFASDEDLENL